MAGKTRNLVLKVKASPSNSDFGRSVLVDDADFATVARSNMFDFIRDVSGMYACITRTHVTTSTCSSGVSVLSLLQPHHFIHLQRAFKH